MGLQHRSRGRLLYGPVDNMATVACYRPFPLSRTYRPTLPIGQRCRGAARALTQGAGGSLSCHHHLPLPNASNSMPNDCVIASSETGCHQVAASAAVNLFRFYVSLQRGACLFDSWRRFTLGTMRIYGGSNLPSSCRRQRIRHVKPPLLSKSTVAARFANFQSLCSLGMDHVEAYPWLPQKNRY